MFCQKCGTQLPGDSGFCHKCGVKLISADTVEVAGTATATSVDASDCNESEAERESQQDSPQKSTKSSHLGWFVGSRFGLTPLWVMGLILGFVLGGTIGTIIHWAVVAILIIRVGLKLKSFINPKESKPSILGILQDVLIAVIAITLVVTLSGGNSGIGGGSNKYVQMVKGGTLENYPQKTVGRAFDNFLDNPKWESGLSEDNERFVNVKGGILYLDKKADLVVQFIIDEDNETFSYNACEINGVPQNNLFFWGLLETIYNDSSE